VPRHYNIAGRFLCVFRGSVRGAGACSASKGADNWTILGNGVGVLNNDGLAPEPSVIGVKLAESAGRRSVSAFDFDWSLVLWPSIFNK